MQMNDLLHRDEAFAKREAARGMHHTFYLFAIMTRLFESVGVKRQGNHEHDAVTTGAHWADYVDPVTGIAYEIRITPKNQKVKT